MRLRRFILLALASFLLPGLVPSGHAQSAIGLYRNGQLIDAFTNVSAPPPSSEQLKSAGTASQSRSGFSGPAVSDETRVRNLTLAQAAQPAVEIRDLLRQMQQAAARNPAADNQRLASLLQQFLVLQDQARATMVATGDRLLQYKLDPSIYQRHLDTMAAFEAGLSEFTNAVNAVLAGQAGALDQAQAVMERLRFREEPDLTKAGPTHVLMQIRLAPTLTREEADALLPMQSSGPAAPALGQRLESLSPVEAAGSPPTPADLAPTIDVQITAEITDKAAALGNSPLAIYEFVRNNIAFQPYLGSRKGSVFTLQQRAGNDTDQASLLLALLRAANIPSRYVRGTVEMTPEQAMAWLGVEDAATAGSILATAGLDGVNIKNGGPVLAIRCTRVWVEAYVPYSNYRGVPNDATGKTWIPLDPAFKGNTVHPGEDVLTAMGFNADTFLADYISTFHAQSPLEKLQADVQAWLNVNRPGTTVAGIERTLALSPLNLGLLPASLPYKLLSVSSRLSELESTKRYQVRFHLYNGGTTFIDYTISLPELISKRLTIDYIGATPADQATIDAYGGIYQTPPNLVNVKPRLKLDGSPVATSANAIGMGYTHNWDLYFLQPVGAQNKEPVYYNTITAGNGQSVGFDTFLDVPLGSLAGSPSSSGSLLESTLYDTAAEYLSRVDRGEEAALRLLRMVGIVDVSEAIVENSVKVTYSLGIPVTFEWTGLIVDADRRIIGPFAANGGSANKVPYKKLIGYDGSNMENRVFEDMYGQEAISTIKILELANDAGIRVCTITSSIAGQCPGFSQPAYVVSAVNAALARGHHVTIPEAPITVHLWYGTGYIDLEPATGAAVYMIIGGISGNISVAGGATVDVWPINLGCAAIPPITGTITPNGFSDGDVLCADNSQITYSVTLQYDCKDANGNIQHKTFGPTSHTVPPTKRTIVKNYGPGEYTISIPGTQVPPVSFTLVYVHFTKTEDATCWQQNGTYNAKALLSSDSTTDDSLLSWAVSPSDATVGSAGSVTFGPSGKSYAVAVVAGAIASCSDTFTLDCLQVTTETVSPIPADRKRTTVGVGEEVDLSASPAISGLTWSPTSDCNPQNGPTTTFTAPDAAGSSVVTLHHPGGTCTTTFSVLAPNGVASATIYSTMSWSLGLQGAGMYLDPVIVGPTTVSFYRVQIVEVGENATNIKGYFTTHAPPSHIGHGADIWLPLDYDNSWPDRVHLYDYPAPWTPGSFEWNIPSKWRVGTGTEKSMTGWNQVFSIEGNGTTTIQKFGRGVTRTIMDVSTTY
jgi:transglutaminase-like putative cysteine protease